MPPRGARGDAGGDEDGSKGVTPIPYLKVALLGLILAANQMSIWMIFTMLPFMVEFYFPEMSVKELGFRGGCEWGREE